MARRRRSRVSARAAPRASFRRRTSRRSSSGLPSLVAYGAYGAVRGKLAQFVRGSFGSFLGGFGNVSDELLLIGAAWAGKRFLPAGMKPIATAAMNVEAFHLGLQVAQGTLLSGGTTNATNGNGLTVYA